ncbi:hypothetical protein N8651_00435, partial [Akkermansiaceae bacterium]|nr:hypothetical protein [Akkermansiaceae bacterium]
GLKGLGMAFALGYLLSSIQVYFLSRIKYSFRFSDGFLKLACIQLGLGGTVFFLIKMQYTMSLPFGILGLAISSLCSLFILNKKMDLIGLIKSKN